MEAAVAGMRAVAPAEVTRFIPVSVNKTARNYFNIARKALETMEYVELSALEAAVVIAVDASFLLTRAKMAAIERVTTAFVQVPSHQPGFTHQRKARIQILLRKTPEFDEFLRANPRPEHRQEEEEEEG